MGSNRSRGWRDAHLGGWFSYDLKVLPDQHQSLMCTYWGLDFGRIFHITVEDEDIALVTLTGDKGGKFFDVEYPIPMALTEGKQKVTVKFKADPGNIAGGVYGCVIVKEKKSEDGLASMQKFSCVYPALSRNAPPAEPPH